MPDAGTPRSDRNPGVARGATTDRDDLVGPAIAILALALLLRAWALTANPPELFEDELSGLVSAWSIATTGHDVERTVLPFLTTRLELKQPLYFVATIPFQAILGQGALAARIPAVLFGVLTTALVGLLATRLTGRAVIGLVTSALFAVSPWAVHYARAGWEPAALLPFSVGGLGALWIGLDGHRPRWVLAGAAILAVGAYAYHPALLMHVVLAGLLIAVQARRLRRGDVGAILVATVAAAAILVPYALGALDPLFFRRSVAISVFGDGVTLDALALAWGHYWAAWDPSFLLGGAAPNPRVNPGPALILATVPFLLAGLDRLLHRRSRADLFLLGWLVLGPLPVALTDDRTVPSLARGLEALPPMTVIMAVGATALVGWLADRLPAARRENGGRVLAIVAAGAVLAGVWGWAGPYFRTYPERSAAWWGYGTSSAFALVREKVPEGAVVCIATSDVSQFTFPHHVELYLPDPRFIVVEGVKDDRCAAPGAYRLALATRELPPGSETIGLVRGLDGEPKFRLSELPGP